MGVLVAVAIAAPSAHAASTRAEYVAQADQICKANEEKALASFKSVFKGYFKSILKALTAGTDIKRTLARSLAKQLGRGNKRFGAMVVQLGLIPPAPGDEAAVTGWLNALVDYKRQIDRSIRILRHGKLRKGTNVTVRAARAVQANSPVQDWGFLYCPPQD